MLLFCNHKAKLLSPVQLNIGARGGVEATAHATRQFLYNCLNKSKLEKLFFRKIFKLVNLSHMVACVRAHFTDLKQYVLAVYVTLFTIVNRMSCN